MNKLFGALRWPPIDNNAHTNQPKTGANNGEEEGDEVRPSRSGGGEVYIHCFGGKRVGSVIKNKIKLSNLQKKKSRPANKFEYGRILPP